LVRFAVARDADPKRVEPDSRSCGPMLRGQRSWDRACFQGFILQQPVRATTRRI
jgi:hypothetical protein